MDFGQKKLRRGDGTEQKVYFMSMLLCRCRYKYIWFQKRPFTSETTVRACEKSFEYFRGIPREIIYDQDAVFLWDENIGDYIMTQVFSAYVGSRPFRPVFCRPADPESKGKVENCVKYVKQNFLTNRSYTDLETLQEQAEAWLKRTGNAMVHATTCKMPFDEWCLECKELLRMWRSCSRRRRPSIRFSRPTTCDIKGTSTPSLSAPSIGRSSESKSCQPEAIQRN